MTAECRMSQVVVPKAFTRLPSDSDKPAIISCLINALADAKKIDPADVDIVLEGALARESIGGTGIGHGIAIPHCRTDKVSNICCAYGSCPDGIDFDSLDGEPVHSVFLLLTPLDKKEQHLTLMRNFASLIRKDHFCQFLKRNEDAQQLVELLAEFEAKVTRAPADAAADPLY